MAGIGLDRSSSQRWSGTWTSPPGPQPTDGLRPTFEPSTTILREAYRRFPLEPMRPPGSVARLR